MGVHLKLENIRLGKLTVIKRIGVNKHKRALWLCKCDCGKDKIVRTIIIKRGKVTSCGCERMIHNRHNNRKFAIIKNLYNKTVRKRNKKWLKNDCISLESFEILSFLNCYYCGTIPSQKVGDRSFNPNGKSNEFIFVNGIDRINSDFGYIDGNVRSCCTKCNIAKNALNDEEFKTLITNIYNTLILQQKN